jgi:ABC-type Na+ efflux pump permease subunit
MTLLPIVDRELRVASRRGATYWTRFTAGLLAIVVGTFVWTFAVRQAPRETGMTLFIALTVVAYVYSLLAGALSSADSVSEEKREGTLGLLFLTDLRPFDIVLGKLAASSLTAIYGMLALFPVISVPLLLGGVTGAEFWRVVLVCLNNLFLSLSLGLLASALSKDERKATGLTILLMLLLTAGVPALVAWAASEVRPGHPLYDLLHHRPWPLLIPSPGFSCVFAFEAPHADMLRTAKTNWWMVGLGVQHGIGWLALALTAWILPRVWRDKAATPKAERRALHLRNWALGTPEMRLPFRRKLLAANPFYWLAARDRFQSALVWVWIGAGMIVWAIGIWENGRQWFDPAVYIMTALCAHTLFKGWVAIEASKRLSSDRRSGALELLLSTPLSVQEILRGQWLALRRQFGPAIALVVLVDALFLIAGLHDVHGEQGEWIFVWVAGISVFLLDLVALALVSMWLSLSSRKSGQAGISALVLVCVLPWFFFSTISTFIFILEEVLGLRMFPNLSENFFTGMWWLLSVGTDVVLISWAYRRLTRDFRAVAMRRFEHLGIRLGRWLGQQWTKK